MKENTRYLFSEGMIERRDDSLLFKTSENNHYLPIKNLKEIYLLNDCTITSKAISLAGKQGILIHFFDYYGNYSGTFYPKEYLLSGNLTLKQVEYFQQNRLNIAKAIVSGISKNIHFILYHYYRHSKIELKNTLDFLKKDIPNLLNRATSINQILMIEGKIWSLFYESFEEFLPHDFLMNKRVRRPPDNPMNALISFGNSILYSKTITQIYHTHLNQTISFLHSPSESRFSLCLDLCEVFKPIIVFRTIFYCINNKKIQVSKHFDKDLNYCILNEKGKRIFLEELDNRFNDTIEHKKLKRKISYKELIRLDGYKLIKTFLEDKDFVPFSIEKGE